MLSGAISQVLRARLLCSKSTFKSDKKTREKMMKYCVAIFCFAQIVLSAPSEPTIAEQAQQTIAKAQQQASAAVSDLNAKILQTAGAKNNVELLSTVQRQSETYANQIKGVADQISQQAAQNTNQISSILSPLAKQLSDQAAVLLGNQDPSKVDQLQNSFASVLQQTGTLSDELKKQSEAVQSMFGDLIGKLYENTVATAKNVATQLDESAKKP